jgi:hypothetical protein
MAEAIHRFEEAAMWIRVVSAESCRGFAFLASSPGGGGLSCDSLHRPSACATGSVGFQPASPRIAIEKAYQPAITNILLRLYPRLDPSEEIIDSL